MFLKKYLHFSSFSLPYFTSYLRKQDKSDEISKNKSLLFHDARELECLLKETAEGREILDSFRSRQLSLTPQHRTKLVSIIINNEVKENPDSCISQRRFIQLSNQIVKIFPGENKNIYYAPFCKMGNTGKTVAKGKLLYRYNLVKQQVEKINPPIVSKKANPTKPVKIVDKNPDDISWLKSNSSPWSEVILKWSNTTKNRLEHYASDDSTIADYLTAYPALQVKNGHKLFEIDFKNLFPDKERKLMDILPKLSKKIFILAEKSDHKEIRNYLGLINENSSEDSRYTVCFLLLSYLLPPPPVHAARHTWRPTPEECRDNFLLHVQSPKLLRGALARRSRRCRLLGVGCQPLPAVVGDLGNGDAPLQALVRVNSNLYRCGDVASCVDVCYKLFHCLNADYPPQSSHVWHFLQHYVYGMTTIFDQEYKCVKELVKQLDELE